MHRGVGVIDGQLDGLITGFKNMRSYFLYYLKNKRTVKTSGPFEIDMEIFFPSGY